MSINSHIGIDTGSNYNLVADSPIVLNKIDKLGGIN